jgi:uncharacterized membrane protein YoaK (UPF0700 family)
MQNGSGRPGGIHSIVAKWLYEHGGGSAYRSDVACEPSCSPHDESSVTLGQLTTACLFAVVGGYMDAYSYLAHGQVFANTQTGNFVLFSLYASQGHWSQAVRHVPPILAFSLGVAVASGLKVHAKTKTWQAPLLCQAFELAILTVLAAVGARLPDASVVPLISFVAALQYTSFNRVGPWSFSSPMNTGNLREATSGWVLWSAGREATADRRKAIILSLICFSFLVGALCGSSYTRRNLAHALWPCVAVVAVGFLLTCRERCRAARASTGTC